MKVPLIGDEVWNFERSEGWFGYYVAHHASTEKKHQTQATWHKLQPTIIYIMRKMPHNQVSLKIYP